MNGVHDLGGMQGFGPVVREEQEPVFHARWETVVVAIQQATRAGGMINIDEFRHGIERMEPAHYLASSYYEHWLDGISRVLIEKSVISAAELDQRTSFFKERPDAPLSAAFTQPASEPRSRPRSGQHPYQRESTALPQFAPGDRVITREMQPAGHTRLPRYARGKRGTIDRLHGVYVFPDTHAHGLGEQPQPLYSVRFEAQDLWGEAPETDQTVSLDLWESYLRVRE
ncbi:MAG: nitrile hydratase subunit beta [Dehalococcoidia bacterium]